MSALSTESLLSLKTAPKPARLFNFFSLATTFDHFWPRTIGISDSHVKKYFEISEGVRFGNRYPAAWGNCRREILGLVVNPSDANGHYRQGPSDLAIVAARAGTDAGRNWFSFPSLDAISTASSSEGLPRPFGSLLASRRLGSGGGHFQLTVKVSVTSWVNTVEPAVIVPVTTRLYVPGGVPGLC